MSWRCAQSSSLLAHLALLHQIQIGPFFTSCTCPCTTAIRCNITGFLHLHVHRCLDSRHCNSIVMCTLPIALCVIALAHGPLLLFVLCHVHMLLQQAVLCIHCQSVQLPACLSWSSFVAPLSHMASLQAVMLVSPKPSVQWCVS